MVDQAKNSASQDAAGAVKADREPAAGSGAAASGGTRLISEAESVREFLTYRLLRLSMLMTRQMHDELQARYDLKVAEWRTIAILGEMGALSVLDVARHSTVDKGQVSRLLPGLTDRGLVNRNDHPTDKRRVSIALTEAGRQLYDEIFHLGLRRQRWLVEPLTDGEQVSLIECLDRMTSRIEQEPRGPFKADEAP